MAYTQADLVAVDAAIADLRDGQRIVTLTIGSVSRTYAAVSIKGLLELRAIIKAEVTPGATRTYASPRRHVP